MALTMLLLQLYAVCQEKPKTDSFFLARKKGWLGKLGKSISVNVATLEEPSVIALMKNINPYIQFKGSVIRKISVSKIGFGQSVNDTAKVVRNIFNDIGQKLHVSTSEKTIKHNLFFKEGDKIYPYLLRGVDMIEHDQVWSTDITFLRMKKGFVYLMAIIDWFSRYVLDWELSITLEADFCIEALARILNSSSSGKCDIFNRPRLAVY